MLVGYFIPTIIAEGRRHHNKAAILVVNLFFGWTLLGWVICLAWSLMQPSQQQTGSHAPKASPPQPNSVDMVDKLERLANLRDKNAITEDEFQRQKAAILGSSTMESSGKVPPPQPAGITEVSPLADRLSNFDPAPLRDEIPSTTKPRNRTPGLIIGLVLVACLLAGVWVSFLVIGTSQTIVTVPTTATTRSGASNSTPHLTDDEIRKHNDEVLARLNINQSQSVTPTQVSIATPAATPTELPTEAEENTDFRIVKSEWEKGGFDNVAIWHVTIKNLTNRAMGNFRYITSYGSETGIQHGSRNGRLEKRLETGPNENVRDQRRVCYDRGEPRKRRRRERWISRTSGIAAP
jgi:hypothetical protein